MVHQMKLDSIPFKQIVDGKKSIELRLFDAKRRLLNIGDKIIFKCLNNDERIAVSVKGLYRAASFKELFQVISTESCGFVDCTLAECIEEIRRFYPKQKEEAYGVLGIKIELISLDEAINEICETAENLYDRYFPDGMK